MLDVMRDSIVRVMSPRPIQDRLKKRSDAYQHQRNTPPADSLDSHAVRQLIPIPTHQLALKYPYRGGELLVRAQENTVRGHPGPQVMDVCGQRPDDTQEDAAIQCIHRCGAWRGGKDRFRTIGQSGSIRSYTHARIHPICDKKPADHPGK